MNKFNYKNWSIKQEIQKRVQLEALQEYREQDIKPKPLPKYIKPEINKHSVGWWNFTKTVLKELKP